MKKAYLATAIISAFVLSACGGGKDDEAAENKNAPIVLETDDQKEAYALGASMGMFVNNRIEQANDFNLAFDRDALIAGFNEGLDGNAQLTMEEIQSFGQAGEVKLRDAANAKAEQETALILKEGQDFLAANAGKEGVLVTESGLQYEVITAGDGASPSATDTVTVHYKGTFLDGTEFDSSYSRGEPASFPLNRVIPGWTEGLQLMQEGATYRFYVPSELAYGRAGSQSIPPNSALIFDVELIAIQSNVQ